MRKISTLCLWALSLSFLCAQEEGTLEVVEHYTTTTTTTVSETDGEEIIYLNNNNPQRRSKLAVGLHLGLDQNGTDTHSWGRHGENILSHAHFTYGLNARYALTKRLGIRADYFGSKISGNDKDNTGLCDEDDDIGVNIDCHTNRGWSFSSPLHEISASIEFDLFGKKRYPEMEYFNADGQKLKKESVRLGYGTYYDEDGEVIHFNEIKRFKRRLSPYIGVGIAMTYVNPDTEYDLTLDPPSPSDIAQDSMDQKNWYMHIPITAGLRWDLSEKFYLDGELRGVIPAHDLLDGMAQVASTEVLFDDNYQFATVRLGYRLGVFKDRDNDGVSDKRDICPDVYGVAALNGCPDRDGDGLSDEIDACPDVKGLRRFAGCPDTDEDGVQDLLDGCPEIPGSVETKGCPDADMDGIIDSKDECPNKFGYADLDGCPDRDGDGIPDHRDACPDVKGEDAYHGCNEGYPELSEENRIKYRKPKTETKTETRVIRRTETINETEEQKRLRIKREEEAERRREVQREIERKQEMEREAERKRLAEANDAKRKLEEQRSTSTTTSSTTRRVVTAAEEEAKMIEVKRVFNAALEGIKFNSSKWTFKQESYALMNNVVSVMQSYPGLRVGINGHTDSTGDANANQLLSQNRANAVKEYLVKNGIDSSRLVSTGYGEVQPIADNATRTGRFQNRRVEFVVLNR